MQFFNGRRCELITRMAGNFNKIIIFYNILFSAIIYLRKWFY